MDFTLMWDPFFLHQNTVKRAGDMPQTLRNEEN